VPVGISGGVVIEPPEIRIGDTARLDVVVVTPPGHHVEPIEAPDAPAGFWILDAETPTVARDPHRWIHTTRFRLRARATGSHSWPASEARIGAPDGSEHVLAIAARPLEVIEVSRERPGQSRPFSFRTPAPARPPGGFLAPALFGAGLALAGVGLFVLVRRARQHERPGAERQEPAPAPWRGTQALLAAALARVDEDPAAAADAASLGLRHFVGERYRTAAAVSTTEELSGTEPPFAMTTRWPGFIQILRSLDGARFRPDPRSPGHADAIRAAIRDGQRLVAESAPQEGAH